MNPIKIIQNIIKFCQKEIKISETKNKLYEKHLAKLTETFLNFDQIIVSENQPPVDGVKKIWLDPDKGSIFMITRISMSQAKEIMDKVALREAENDPELVNKYFQQTPTHIKGFKGESLCE